MKNLGTRPPVDNGVPMKCVLLAVCGLSPQVVTETLYALHQQGKMPDAIRVLTTREGKIACSASLLNPVDGEYFRFLREYGIDPASVDFGPHHVWSVTDENGIEIDDISGEEENRAFLSACMETAFELTQDPDCDVFFSIAGGRKTMGACLTIAAQFYGRPQDRLYHVLVSPEFESSRNFFFPPAVSEPVTLYDRQGQPYSKETRFAKVTLFHLPFVSLRDRLEPRRLKRPEEPAALMLSLVREKRHELVIDLLRRKLVWKGVEVDMMPARLAIYAFFAMRKKESSCERRSCRECDECYLSAIDVLDGSEEIVSLYRKTGMGRDCEEMSTSGIRSLTAENFNSYKSKIRSDLEKGFGAHEMKQLEIISRGHRPRVRYGISLDRARIRVVL
jgi:CRISPR-associated protein (TIGR02584 family)